jgi:hypothetical protein
VGYKEECAYVEEDGIQNDWFPGAPCHRFCRAMVEFGSLLDSVFG